MIGTNEPQYGSSEYAQQQQKQSDIELQAMNIQLQNTFEHGERIRNNADILSSKSIRGGQSMRQQDLRKAKVTYNNQRISGMPDPMHNFALMDSRNFYDKKTVVRTSPLRRRKSSSKSRSKSRDGKKSGSQGAYNGKSQGGKAKP